MSVMQKGMGMDGRGREADWDDKNKVKRQRLSLSIYIYILISDINVFCQCFFSRETLNSNRSKPSQEGVACFFLEVRR